MRAVLTRAVRPHAGSSGPHRVIARLLGIAPATLLLTGLLAVWAAPLAAPAAASAPGPLAAPVAAAAPTGVVAAWGANDSDESTVPTNLSGVTAIAADGAHSLALKSDGTVVAWGDNTFGQSFVPPGLSNVTAIAAGTYHSLALKSDGKVVAWGYNDEHQTDIPAGLSGVTAIAAGWGHSLAVKSDGTVVAWGWDPWGETDVPAGLSNVTAIAAGDDHSLALKSDGTVVAWGEDFDGEAPPNLSELSDVVAIAAGQYHSLALRSDATVVAFGDNSHGQIDVPAGLSGVKAIAASGDHSVALRSDGTVVAWGDNGSGETNIPAGLSGVTAIAAGGDYSLALVSPPQLTVSGIPSHCVAGAAHNVTVTARGSSGEVASWYRGMIHFTSTDPAAILPGNYTFTSADAGVHQFSLGVTLKTAGSRAVHATDAFTAAITGIQSGIAVTPAKAKTLVVSGMTTPRTAGTAGTVRVTAKDAYGNTATGYTGAIHFSSSDAKAKLPANYTFTAADNGTHVFNGTVILKTAGTRSVTATDTVIGSTKGSQSGVVVKAAALSKLVVSGLATPRMAGTAGSIRVTATDAYGNRIWSYRGKIHFTSSDAKAKLPANYTFTGSDAGTHVFSVTLKTAGTQSVTATDTKTATIKGHQAGIVVKS
jgi:hypothetical protein